MAGRFILGNKPLPRGSVNLGRLVMSIADPQEFFYDSPKASSLEKTCTVTHYRDFQGIDEFDQGKSFGLKMTKLAALSRSKRRGRAHHLETKCVTHYKVRNYRQYFLDMIQLPEAKKWIETAIKEGRRISYLVGFMTFENAAVTEYDRDFRSTELNLTAPTTALVTASLGVPAPVTGGSLDAGVSLGGDRRGAILSQYTVHGEQVFALEYRRVKISLLNSRDVKLPQGPTQWHLLTTHRFAYTVDTNDIVVADVNESEEREEFEFDDDGDDDDETGPWTKVETKEEGDFYI